MTAVYVDLETGGLDLEHPIIQIAAIAVDENTWTEIGRFERKIDFDESEATPTALALNHYDRSVWKNESVSRASALAGFADFCEPHKQIPMISRRGSTYLVARLVGHNAVAFDAPRLFRAAKIEDIFLPADPRVRCTQQRAIWFFEENGIRPPANYKLTTLCEYFGIPLSDRAHDAMADISMTVQLARRLKEESRKHG